MRKAIAEQMDWEDLEVELNDGRDSSGKINGYVSDGGGSYLFTIEKSIEDTVATLEPDEVETPDFDISLAQDALRRAFGGEEV